MLSLFYNFIQFGLIMYICYLCLRTDWLVCESLFHFQFYYHFRSVCMIQRHITWPTSVCQRRLPTVITSLALQFLGPSWCPGLGRLLASAALQCMAPGPGTDGPPTTRIVTLLLSSVKHQLKTHLFQH